MFESLKQKIKHKVAEAKEAHAAYKEAKHEEKIRLQHLEMLKKMDAKKSRIEAAKRMGVKSEHKAYIAKEKANKVGLKLKESVRKAKEKADPILKQLTKRAEQYAKKQIIGRPHRKRRAKKARNSRKRRY